MAEHSRGRQMVFLATQPRYHVAKLLELNEVVTVRAEDTRSSNEKDLKIVNYNGKQYHAVLFDSGGYAEMELTRDKLIDYERTLSQYRSLGLTSTEVQTDPETKDIDVLATGVQGESEQTSFIELRSAFDSILGQQQEPLESLGWGPSLFDQEFQPETCGPDNIIPTHNEGENMNISDFVATLPTFSDAVHDEMQGPSTQLRPNNREDIPPVPDVEARLNLRSSDSEHEGVQDIEKGGNIERRAYCIFCNTYQTQLPWHLVRAHVDEERVQSFADLPQKNRKRLEEIRKLRLEGELKTEPDQVNASSEKIDRVLAPRFQILNLVPDSPQIVQEDFEMRVVQESTTWRPVGDIVGQNVHLDTVVWPGGDLVPVSTSRGVRSVFRVVTSLAPPFVMEGELDEDGQCLRGLECHRLLTSDKDNLTLVFNEMERMEDAEEESELPERDIWAMGSIFQNSRYKYRTNCCYGLSMDLLENVAQELEFDFHLYIVADEAYGSRVVQNNGEIKWNGIVGDLVSGAAHMSFSALSVSSPRSQVIDFSVPYFFSGVSFLAAPRQRTDIPLLAFLLPFSPELWIAIFTSLNVTAVAVAIYEWLSPFGLNPWGRQRSKNFSMSSALWVCWGLLCGHLVAFKAPKSWPNKFLINVWGGFSVIFVASYTANIAALIAGLFFHNAVGDYHDRSLLSQRVGTPRASAADYYVHRANQVLWEHMQRYSVKDVATGVQHLKNGSLDILIADTPILDYYRATDHGCKLQKIGDAINEDTYAVGMTKGFPLKDSISAVIAKYSSNGYMDILQEKWYGGLPCFKLATDMAQPRPLGVAAVTGVFLLLGMGMLVGCLILLIEHLFYRYTLPILRHKPKGTIWRSRNIMFFSQKLYRFINCVELVSPHHAARELVHTLRQGQITSLFQKSVKRKEHEQRRRRRSKAQFFEMIQEIRRVQQEEKVVNAKVPMLTLPEEKSPKPKKQPPSEQNRRHSRLDLARRLSKEVFRSKSSSNLSIRRLSSDINMAAGRFLDCHSSQAIGRRLSRDTNPSPPDINSRRASHLSISRKPSSQFLSPSDAESSSDLSVTPRSPNLTNTQSTSMRLLQTLPKSPDYLSTATRFRYVDIKSPSFKTKLSRFKEPLQEDNPKVIIHHDKTEPAPPPPTTSTAPPTPPPRTSSQEHFIEIIIPPEDKPVPAERLKLPGETLQPSRSLTGLSVLEQISTLEQTQNRPPPPTAPKPKIVSYLPKKHRKLSTEVGHRRVNGKTRKRACSDSIIRTEESKPDTKPDLNLVVENCEVFLPSESTPLSRLSRAELMTLSQIPEHELKRKLKEAIENRDPT